MSLKTGLEKATKAILRIAYTPLRSRRLRRKVTIISRQSNEPTLDIRLLGSYLEENHGDLELQVLCRNLEKSNKILDAFHLLRQLWHISNSAAVVLDGYCIPVSVLDHRRSTKVVQMWHALAAVKKFGYQSLDRPGGRSSETARIMHMHRNYDVVLCPGERTGYYFCQAFDADETKLEFLGLPRIDRILHPEAESEKAIRAEYDLPEDKEILLYVPTFRKGEPIPLHYLAENVPADRFVLVVRLHPLYGEYEIEEEGSGPGNGSGEKISMIIDRKFSSYEWLDVCDRVITDYSALGVEAALTGKPVYFYVYDIDRYMEDVGLNLDPRQELPGASAETAEELAELLLKPYDGDALERFRRRYITVDTENCTEKLGEYIYGIAEKIH